METTKVTFETRPKPESAARTSIFHSSFKRLTRRRRPSVFKLHRVKQQAITEKYVKTMTDTGQRNSKRQLGRLKLIKLLWKSVKSRATENLNVTLDYDAVDLRDLDPRGELLKYAVCNNYSDIGAVLVRHNSPLEGSGEDGLSPLHLAIKLGYMPILTMILDMNVSINVQALYEKRTALHMAVRMNNTEALNLLLQHGADTNKPDIYGGTPLHLAARLGRNHLIRRLIAHDARVLAIDNEGWTPLHVASEAGHVTTVRILLQNNSCVDAQSNYGRTALHWACDKANLQVVHALLDSKANPLIRDLNNKTACDYTVMPLLRNLLQSYMPNPELETKYTPSNYHIDCRVNNKSLIDLLDIEDVVDDVNEGMIGPSVYDMNVGMIEPGMDDLNEDMIGRGAMQDEISKPLGHHAKSMLYILDSRTGSDSVERSPDIGHCYSTDDIGRHLNRQISNISLASFVTVTDSEIDFAMSHSRDTLLLTPLHPIREDAHFFGSCETIPDMNESGLCNGGSDIQTYTTASDWSEAIAVEPKNAANHPLSALVPSEPEAILGDCHGNYNNGHKIPLRNALLGDLADSGFSDGCSDVKIKNGGNLTETNDDEITNDKGAWAIKSDGPLVVDANEVLEPKIVPEVNSESYSTFSETTDQSQIKIKQITHHLKHGKVAIKKGTDNVRSKVPIAKLIETLDEMQEKVDTSVDANVNILNDVFRDVIVLRHGQDDVGLEARETTFDNIEKNIKDIVVQLKQLKVQLYK